MWPFRRRKRASSANVAPELVSEGRFRRESARQYAVGVPYLLPKDVEESNRLDYQHYVIRYALKGNFVAPIQHPSSILDVGTGTGRWAREMATQFPLANVVGVDIVEPPADEAADEALARGGYDPRPGNYTFVAANVLEGLPFADSSFDFVHQRLLFLALPADRWPQVVRELARVTRPGGWVELIESSVLINPGPATDAVQGWGGALGKHRGVDMRVSPMIGDFMQGAGLLNVERRILYIPLGRWGGRLGRLMVQNMVSAFRAIRPIVTAQGLTSEQEFDATIAALPREWDRQRTIVPFFVAWGQHP